MEELEGGWNIPLRFQFFRLPLPQVNERILRKFYSCEKIHSIS